MAVNRLALRRLVRFIGKAGVARLRASAEKIDRVDNAHRIRVGAFFDRVAREVTEAITTPGKSTPRGDVVAEQVLEMLLDHWHDAAHAGIEEATTNSPAVNAQATAHLAAPKPGRMPRNLRELRELYDYFRKNPGAAKRQAALADKIKRRYLKAVGELVRTLTVDFNAGAAISRDEIAAAVKKKIAAVFARAKTTLETESTRNYNAARRAVYDRSPDVTHYLFVCVRDFATTQWCRTRDKLVYTKGSGVLDRETPPIHWNCRSELLPLTMQNPMHAKLINDLSRRRERNRPKPLPRGWVISHAA